MLRLLFSSVLLTSLSSLTLAHDDVVSLHGSGTTNPSKCYWHVMDQMSARSKIPLKPTYRAIGSGSGQDEFLATGDPVVDFASGDIAIPKDRYDEMQSLQIPILQLPVFLGAVGFFHNVNLLTVPHLNLNACVLAKIFSGTITKWDDTEILDLNPGFTPSPSFLNITVVHRSDGSSSTSAMTTYLNAACPSERGSEKVGKTSTWPEGSNFEACQGSGGVTACLNRIRGSISYLDVGHGHLNKLGEVRIENLDGTTLSSLTAIENNGISAAADQADLPSFASGDFSEVTLINQPGQYTWPVVSTTYLYVRQDLSFITDPMSRAFLVAFLEALYDDSYLTDCEEMYKLNRVKGKALTIAQEGIQGLLDEADKWNFEADTVLVEGTGETWISGKRRSSVDVSIEQKRLELEQLKDELYQVSDVYAGILNKMSLLQSRLAVLYEQKIFDMAVVEAYDATGPRVAIAFSVITLIFWISFGVIVFLASAAQSEKETSGFTQPEEAVQLEINAVVH